MYDYEELKQAIEYACKKRGYTPNEKYKIYLFSEYPAISLKHEKIRLHRIIGEYMTNMELPKHLHVHHIDGNKLNAQSCNLQVISNNFHTKKHSIVQYVSKEQLRKNARAGALKITRKDVDKKMVEKLKRKYYT